MRKLTALIFLLPMLFLSEVAPGQSRAPLSRVQDVVALTNAQAGQYLPVQLQATVTYVRPSESNLFVMDDGFGTYVRFDKDIGLVPGDRVSIIGVTDRSFRPVVKASGVRFLAHGAPPKPRPADFESLIQSKFDAQYIQVDGHVLSAVIDDSKATPVLLIKVKVPEGSLEAIVAHPGDLRPEDLLDTDVRMTGVAGGAFNSRMQMAGVWLDMYSDKNIVILHRPASDPWSLPARPVNEAVFAYRNSNSSQRVRIVGGLTYFEPGSLAVVEQQGNAILVETNSALPLHAGMGVEAIGFPAISNENVHLEFGQLRPAEKAIEVEPQTIQWEQATTGAFAYNLVAMEGVVMAVVHDSRVDAFIILSQGHLFSATLRHSSSDAADPVENAATPIIGSRVRVTGVCFVDAGNHWRDRLWFDLRMRSLKDVVVLQQPSWWTVKRLAYVVTLLSIIILGAVIWAGLLDRRLRKQTAVLARQSQEDAIRQRQLARQEQQRSQILELISSPASLPEVLREIQAMVSSRLYGASCWFELSPNAGGAAAMDIPAGPAIVSQQLTSPDGASLGFLLTAPLLHSSANDDISVALVAGARLAELAIDTRRLYSDLRHRSEYDLLTDIPNRFSMERNLDHLMLSARRNEAVFGLIYVDLDRFKQVNDCYGHRVGDLYLQAATQRMKLQLRSGDVLARIGGDEFIALVPIHRGRADAEEIAQRLERCFDGPFDLEDVQVYGSASVGLAVYPEDGTSKEELQRSADAAMYANKQEKRRNESLAEVMQPAGGEDQLC